MPSHSSILAWKAPWTEEPGGLQSTGSQKKQTHQQQNNSLPNTLLKSYPILQNLQGQLYLYFFSSSTVLSAQNLLLTSTVNFKRHLIQ